MAGSQHFYPCDIQFQVVFDKGQCVDSSYLNQQDAFKSDTALNDFDSI